VRGDNGGGAGETGGGTGASSAGGSDTAGNPQDDKTAMPPISNAQIIHAFFLNRLPEILKQIITK